MPKDSAYLWNISFFYQMTCWGCHMACMWHSVQDNRAWVYAWFCPLGWDDRSRACLFWFHWLVWCNHSVALAFNILHNAFFRFPKNMNHTEARRAEGVLLLLFLSDKGKEEADELSNVWSKDGDASAEPGCQWSPGICVCHHCQQQPDSLCFKELISLCLVSCKPPHQRFML